MGSGSFGGGSGSFGGSSGGGSGRTGQGTDSVQERILRLSKLTQSVNDNPEMANVRATIERLLRDRTRAAYLKVALTDGMLNSAYKSLLSLGAELRGGASVASAVTKRGTPGGGTLADFADVICSKCFSADTDERTESVVRRAVRDLLLRTVGNQQDLYYETPVENLGAKFIRNPLGNTADFFLGTVIGEAVRRDLLTLSDEARAVIGQASHDIAVRWIDKFKDWRKAKSASFREVMRTVGNDYAAYSGGADD